MENPETNSVTDWKALITAARQGDREAFGRIAAALQQYLIEVAEQGLGHRMRSKFGPSDVVQRTFQEASLSFNTFSGNSGDELRHWFRAIVLNNLTDESKRYTNTQSRDIDKEVSLDGHSLASSILTSPIATPYDELRQGEVDHELVTAVSRLTPRQRYVVEQRHRFDRSHKEVGNDLGISEEAARQLWKRALETLRNIMRDPNGSW